MPDNKPYKDTPGFTETDNGIIADPSVAGSAGDYNNWDWKQIMAAVVGGSAMSGDGGNALSHGLVDPQTLWDAGRAFDKVKNTLQMVGKAISDQSKALAGPDGPWKGPAATAFLALMDKFSQQVLANAERFSGGDAGINPVGTQLWNMGNQLSYAQYEIHAIDSWYAHQASLVGASTMNNGLIHIGDSKYDKIREMMTKDMRQVLHDLADKYTTVKVNPPAAGGGGSGQGDPPPYKPEPGPGPGDGPGDGPGGDGGPNPDDFKFDNGPGSGGPEGGPQPQNFDGGPPPADMPGGDGPQAQDFPGGDGPQPQAFTGGGPQPQAFDGGPQPQDFTGGDNPPQDFQGGPGVDGPQQPGGDGTGGPNGITPFPGMGGLNNGGPKDTGGSSDIKPFPGKGSGPGSGAQGNGPGDLGNIKPAEFPGMGTNGMGDLPSTVNPVAPPSEWGAGQAPDGVQLPDNRGGSPMPPMTGMPMGQGGSGGGAGGAPERPDSSGLLDGGVEPWKGGTPPIGDPNGLDTPSSNPADWAAPGTDGIKDFDKSGMPPMSGMPMGQGSGMGGAGGGTAAERPDSAGLLDGGVEPWKSGEMPGGDPSGVDAPALNPADWAAPGDSGKGVQMPGMPGMPMGQGSGMGGAGGGTAAERPDSAGLLDGGAEPWKGGELPGGDPSGVDAPALNPADWAAPGDSGKGVQMPGMPGMPMGQGSGMGGAGGGTAAERPDSAGLLDGGAEPWTGSELPGGDPSAVDAPALNPADWAASGDSGKGVQTPGMPGMPMGQGSGVGGGTPAERPDSAGLLDGGTEPWTGGELPGGNPSGVDTPALDPAAWAVPGRDQGVQAPGMPGMPMSPIAGGAGGGVAERPDSAGLLDGGTEPWTGTEQPGGDPAAVAAPVVAPAPWSAPPERQPGMPFMPMGQGAATGSDAADRPDSAELLDGDSEPWSSPGSAVGEPVVAGAPALDPTTWNAPGVPRAPGTEGLASLVDGTATPAPEPVDRVAVVAQPDGREDTSSWNTGGAGFLTLLWPLGSAKDDHRGEEEIATDYVLRDTEPWTPTPDPADYATWQPKKQGELPPPEQEAGERRLSCTDLGEAPAAPVEETKESEKDDESDEEEETPRSSSDLLKQDDGVWGGSGNKSTGVLE